MILNTETFRIRERGKERERGEREREGGRREEKQVEDKHSLPNNDITNCFKHQLPEFPCYDVLYLRDKINLSFLNLLLSRYFVIARETKLKHLNTYAHSTDFSFPQCMQLLNYMTQNGSR